MGTSLLGSSIVRLALSYPLDAQATVLHTATRSGPPSAKSNTGVDLGAQEVTEAGPSLQCHPRILLERSYAQRVTSKVRTHLSKLGGVDQGSRLPTATCAVSNSKGDALWVVSSLVMPVYSRRRLVGLLSVFVLLAGRMDFCNRCGFIR